MTFIDFGKYKGCDLDDILQEDPEYIIWLYENNVSDLVDEDLYQEAIDISALNRVLD